MYATDNLTLEVTGPQPRRQNLGLPLRVPVERFGVADHLIRKFLTASCELVVMTHKKFGDLRNAQTTAFGPEADVGE